MNAIPHHIGCAVRRLEEGVAVYAGALGLKRKTRSFEVASQGVRVCFVELGPRFYLELIAPVSQTANLASFLQAGFYHLCFLVDDLEAARAHLSTRGFLAMSAFQSDAFAGKTCQFFASPQTHLIELAEISTDDFAGFFRANLTATNSPGT